MPAVQVAQNIFILSEFDIPVCHFWLVSFVMESRDHSIHAQLQDHRAPINDANQIQDGCRSGRVGADHRKEPSTSHPQ
jgi:hypothetical protein